MCPYCKGTNLIIKGFNKNDCNMAEVKLKPDPKYYRNIARIGLCRECNKEHLITTEYKPGKEANGPYFCHRKKEEVEVVE